MAKKKKEEKLVLVDYYVKLVLEFGKIFKKSHEVFRRAKMTERFFVDLRSVRSGRAKLCTKKYIN